MVVDYIVCMCIMFYESVGMIICFFICVGRYLLNEIDVNIVRNEQDFNI